MLKALRRESILFAGCLLFGLVLLPLAVFLVGSSIFGDFGSGGLKDFVASLYAALSRFDAVVWFLILSPYLFIQSMRGTFRLFRAAKPD